MFAEGFKIQTIVLNGTAVLPDHPNSRVPMAVVVTVAVGVTVAVTLAVAVGFIGFGATTHTCKEIGPDSWTRLVDPTHGSGSWIQLVDPTLGPDSRSCSGLDSGLIHAWEVFN